MIDKVFGQHHIKCCRIRLFPRLDISLDLVAIHLLRY